MAPTVAVLSEWAKENAIQRGEERVSGRDRGTHKRRVSELI